MNKNLTNKLDPILALLAFVLLFLTRKEVLPNFIYSIIAGIIALYFFPIKFLLIKKQGSEDSKALKVFSYLTLAGLLDLSIIYLFASPDGIFRTLLSIISIINVGFAYYYLAKGKDLNMSILHFSFCFLSSASIFI